MKSNFSLAIIYALAKFSILIIGFFLLAIINEYLFKDSPSYSDIGVPTFPGLVEFFLSTLIWLIVWYIIIFILLNGAKIKGNKLHKLSNIISLIIPPSIIVTYILWFSVVYPAYHQYLKNRLIENQNSLTKSIIKGNNEEALRLIDNYKYDNYRVKDSDSNIIPILIFAAKNDLSVYEALLNEFENSHLLYINTQIDRKNGNCILYYLNDENITLKSIERFDFRFAFKSPEYKGYCDNKDLLIYFIEKKWTNCIESYLTKFENTNYQNYSPSHPYNCQIRFKDSKSKNYQYKTVNPYNYTDDFKTISILNKYSFWKEYIN